MKRMMTALACACMLAAGCTPQTSSAASTQSTDTGKEAYSNFSADVGFDTVFSYKETSAVSSEAAERYQKCCDILSSYNELFDIYNDYDGINNLKTINDNAGIAPVEVDPIIIDMLKMARDFYDISGGEFDVTMGALLKVWHMYRENGIALNEKGEQGQVPSVQELEDAAQYRGWEHVTIDDVNNTVYIDDPHISLDVGGIAKGYATEAAALDAENNGMESGFVNVGRNIRTVGMKAENTPWTVGIADPEGEMINGLLAIAEPGSFSFVTSGDYERYYIGNDGKTYSHIIDPQTMYPATYYRSVTILTADSAAADCLSTTLFTMSIEDGKEVLKEYEEKYNTTAAAVWIMEPDQTQNEEGKEVDDYYVVMTDGLEDSVTWEP